MRIANGTGTVRLVAAIYKGRNGVFLDRFKLSYNQNIFSIACRVTPKTFSSLQASLIAVFKERCRNFSW
jgi:hypothetical protein